MTTSRIDIKGFVCLANLIICVMMLSFTTSTAVVILSWVGITMALCGILSWLFWPGKEMMKR